MIQSPTTGKTVFIFLLWRWTCNWFKVIQNHRFIQIPCEISKVEWIYESRYFHTSVCVCWQSTQWAGDIFIIQLITIGCLFSRTTCTDGYRTTRKHNIKLTIGKVASPRYSTVTQQMIVVNLSQIGNLINTIPPIYFWKRMRLVENYRQRHGRMLQCDFFSKK